MEGASDRPVGACTGSGQGLGPESAHRFGVWGFQNLRQYGGLVQKQAFGSSFGSKISVWFEFWPMDMRVARVLADGHAFGSSFLTMEQGSGSDI